jgi:hypothetical protein
MLIVSGNPVLSTPGGAPLDEAFAYDLTLIGRRQLRSNNS